MSIVPERRGDRVIHAETSINVYIQKNNASCQEGYRFESVEWF